MTAAPTPWPATRPSQLARVADGCGVVAAGIGLLVVAGWMLDIEPLKRVLPGFTSMKFNTALGLVAAGAALRWRSRPQPRLVLGALVALLGAMSLGESLGGWDLRIDQLFVRDVVVAPPEAGFPPGRMAPSTAFCFLLIGVALMGTTGSRRRLRAPGLAVELLALTATVIAGVSLIGYPTGVVHLRQLPGYVAIALHTAGAFVVLGVGLLCAAEGVVASALRFQGTGRALWIGFGVLTCLLATVGVLFSLNLQGLADDLDAQANVARPRREAVLELEKGVLDYGLAVGLALAGDPRGRPAVAEDLTDVQGHLGEYSAVATTDDERALEARFRDQWREVQVLGQGLLELRAQPRPEELLRFSAARLGLQKLLEDEMQPEAMEAFEARRATTLKDLRTTGDWPWLLLVASVLLALVTSGAVARTVSGQEHALRDQGEWLRVTLSSIGDGVIACDAQGHVTFLNPVAQALTGWKQEEALGQPVTTVLHLINEETRQPGADIAAQVLRERRVVALANHTSLMTRDGREVPIEDSAAPMTDRQGALTGAVLVFHDVTQRRRALARLTESEARLRLLSDTASRLLAAENPQTVVDELCERVMKHLDCQVFVNFLVDADAGKLRLNASTGLPAETVARLEWLDFGVAICGCVARDKQPIVAEDIQTSSDDRAALVRSLGVQAYCCHPLMVQGRVIGTLSFGTKARTRFSAEEVETMRTVADQVATAMERMLAQEAVHGANERLVEADRRKNEFLAVLSHELRNPLAPIRNSLYVLEHAAPGGDQSRRAQQVIDRQTGHLTRLVDDLLDVTRISQNKIRLERQRLDLGEVVRRTVEDHHSLFEKGEVRLEVRLPAERVPVNADVTRLAQVIGNLLQNAAKFTGRGGRATVAVSVDAQSRRAELRISDTGVGISPDLLGRLFQPFMQADTTLDRSKGGLGLGLALVKGLVELHGGEVRVRSDGPGKGTEFEVRLPLAGLEAVAPSGSTGAAVAHPGRRVLIIEDNVDAADSLREVLELGEHEVAVAHTGSEGLTKAREFRPQVVLCDIGLPGMDGFEVARSFKADETLKGSLLVALSGYTLQEDLQRASEAGFERHLSKPPNIEKLEALLNGL